jgi:hypothetical protein
MTLQQIKNLIINYQIELYNCTDLDSVYVIGDYKGKIALLINMYNTALQNN